MLAMLMGGSPAATVRMPKCYGHIGPAALRGAVEAISAAGRSPAENTEKPEGCFDNPFDLKADVEANAPKS